MLSRYRFVCQYLSNIKRDRIFTVKSIEQLITLNHFIFSFFFSECKHHRKFYPQRPNRSKLNYRDLDRGIYDNMHQNMWAFSISPERNKTNRQPNGEIEIIDLSIDDDDDNNNNNNNNNNNDVIQIIEDSNEKTINNDDDDEQIFRRLWCLCKQPWDHLRTMLRCDSCANWFHSDW